MANREQLAKLKKGIEAWNQWREQNPDIQVDLSWSKLVGGKLSNANLSKANLRGATLCLADLTNANLGAANLEEADLTQAKLSGASLRGAYLFGAELEDADLEGADLTHAKLYQANLVRVSLVGATLRRTKLMRTNLNGANLSGADLSEADLTSATLVRTNLERANLTNCTVYGISVWDAELVGAIQSNLVITPDDESVIQVDNIEVAQFIYLLLNNEKIRHVIDTITSKVVLILGRFTSERKDVLDAIRDLLRKNDYLPVLFDFEKPSSKDLTGTVSTLANLARFIIADLTDPSCIPHELATVVPSTVVPVQPILLEGQREYAMFADLKTRYHWVLEPHQYKTKELLIAHLHDRVLAPAQAKARELARK